MRLEELGRLGKRIKWLQYSASTNYATACPLNENIGWIIKDSNLGQRDHAEEAMYEFEEANQRLGATHFSLSSFDKEYEWPW
jgi:hypothetical protein